MSLSVRLLGTSASRPTIERNVASVAVVREGETLLFDCGEGTQRQMLRYGVSFALQDIFFTHFHADHEGGLRDFPAVPIYAAKAGWDAARGLQGLASLRAAHLPDLLPPDFTARVRLLEFSAAGAPDWVPDDWRNGADVLGDGTLWAVPLPGHAAGQLGLMFLDDQGNLVFLVADAIWRTDWLLPAHGPRWPVRLITHDWQAFQETLTRLRQLTSLCPDIRIVPFHCSATAQEFGVREGWK